MNIRKLGNLITYDDKDQMFNISMTQFLSESTKNFVFLLTVPKEEKNEELKDINRHKKILSVEAYIKPVSGSSSEPIILKSNLSLSFYSSTEEDIKDIDFDNEVL